MLQILLALGKTELAKFRYILHVNIEIRMRYSRAREKRFVVAALILTGMLFLTIGSSSSMFATITLQPVQAVQQSQVTTCSEGAAGDVCQTTTCTNNEPCHTFQSNNDAFAYKQPQNDVTMMESLEDTPTEMQQEEDTLMEPFEEAEDTTMTPEDDMEVIEEIMDD
jgi:hypothetical protein